MDFILLTGISVDIMGIDPELYYLIKNTTNKTKPYSRILRFIEKKWCSIDIYEINYKNNILRIVKFLENDMFYIVYNYTFYRKHTVLYKDESPLDILNYQDYIEWVNDISKLVIIKESGIFIL